MITPDAALMSAFCVQPSAVSASAFPAEIISFRVRVPVETVTFNCQVGGAGPILTHRSWLQQHGCGAGDIGSSHGGEDAAGGYAKVCGTGEIRQ